MIVSVSLAFAQSPPPPPAPIVNPEIAVTMDVVSTDPEAQRVAALEQRLQEVEARLAVLEAAPAGEAVTGFQDPVEVAPDEVVPEAVSFWGPVVVHGRVVGDAVSFGHDVRVVDGAQVGGNAVSFGGRVIVEPGGSVRGDRISYAQTPERAGILSPPERSWLRTISRKLVSMLTLSGAGVLVVGLFPNQVGNVARAISDRPFKLGFQGALASGLAGFVGLFLLFSIVLSPFVLVVAAAVAVAWLLGFLGLCQAVGDKLPIAHAGVRRWLAFLAGVSAIAFFGSLPLLAQGAVVIAGFACIGAAASTRYGTRELLD